MVPIDWRSSAARPEAPGPGAAPRTPATLRVGGLQRFTSIDYPGALAAVVFVQGCPWRCVYCHNPQLQARTPAAGSAEPSWDELRRWLPTRCGLLDAVVFSGGEPCADPALPEAIAEVKAWGFKVGLHTAGLAPQRLQALCAGPQPLLDWVGLDIKAPLRNAALHAGVTGVRSGTAAVRRSLALLLDSQRAHGLAFECRTTAHPALLDETALLDVADELAAAGVAQWALQICRSEGATNRLPAVDAGYPSAATLQRLRERLPGLVVRRG